MVLMLQPGSSLSPTRWAIFVRNGFKDIVVFLHRGYGVGVVGRPDLQHIVPGVFLSRYPPLPRIEQILAVICFNQLNVFRDEGCNGRAYPPLSTHGSLPSLNLAPASPCRRRRSLSSSVLLVFSIPYLIIQYPASVTCERGRYTYANAPPEVNPIFDIGLFSVHLAVQAYRFVRPHIGSLLECYRCPHQTSRPLQVRPGRTPLVRNASRIQSCLSAG